MFHILSKIHGFIKTHKIFVQVGIVALLLALSITIYTVQVRQLPPIVQKVENVPDKKKLALQEPESKVTTELSSVNTPDNSTAQSPVTSQSRAVTSTQPVQKPAPDTLIPKAVFAISSVSLSDAQYYCGSGTGTLVLSIGGARIGTSSNAGGVFAWQLEISGAWNIPPVYSSSVTIPAGAQSATLGDGYNGEPGVLYSDGYAKGGESLRVHVTSPNDIASAWFTIPAGAEQNCS